MKKKRILSVILITILLIVGVATVVLYKLGDRIFDEAINMQITEMEKLAETTNTSDTISPKSEPQATIQQSEQATGSTQIPVAKSDTTTGQDAQITTEKLKDIKESVTPSDKMAAAKWVLSKLSKSDISHLRELSAGGITPEEKEQMKDIVYSRFTSEEIQKIREMYIKYMK